MSNDPKVLTLTSGKGGVGKSIISANLANILSYYDYKVLIIDMSLGLSNQDIIFSTDNRKNLLHLLKDEASLDDVIIELKQNLSLLSNDSSDEIFNYHPKEIETKLQEVISHAKSFDYIIIDNLTGISPYVQLAIKLADEAIIVSEATPISITDAYTSIKIAKKFDKSISIIFNKVSGSYEADLIFNKLEKVVLKNLDTKDKLQFLGSLSKSNLIEKSTKNRVIFTDTYPNSHSSSELNEIVKNLIFKLEQKMLYSKRRKSLNVFVRRLIEKF